MRRWYRLVTVGLFVLLQAGALVRADEDSLVALQKAEATWAAIKPKTYQFTLEVRCFCALAKHPVSFRVSEEKSELLDELDVGARQTYDYYNTIDKLFAALRRVATRKPFKMAVTYHEVLGYPVQADLDPSLDTFDDELFFRVMAFKALSSPIRRAE